MFTTNIAYTQLPRGETTGSMFDASDDPLGLFFILGIVHIYLGFKTSSSQGIINLLQVGSVIFVILIFPKLGALIIAALVGMLLFIIIKNYFR